MSSSGRKELEQVEREQFLARIKQLEQKLTVSERENRHLRLASCHRTEATPTESALQLYCGHDMRVWPPSNILRPTRREAPMSWLAMPIIMDAAGIRSKYFAAIPRDRLPPRWCHWVQRVKHLLARKFKTSARIRSWIRGKFDALDSDHLPKKIQEQLIEEAGIENEVTTYWFEEVSRVRNQQRLERQAMLEGGEQMERCTLNEMTDDERGEYVDSIKRRLENWSTWTALLPLLGEEQRDTLVRSVVDSLGGNGKEIVDGIPRFSNVVIVNGDVQRGKTLVETLIVRACQMINQDDQV